MTSTAASPFQSASCSGTSACNCSFEVTPTLESENGAWSATGGKLSLGMPPDTANVLSYCVQGDVLRLQTMLEMTPGMGMTMTIPPTLVLSRN
ncbi:MAG: hypothetical protein MJD61_01955 [Proteobacteria bacterium]|nr:hypothetical protein [Pseudomonadota bacterium]